MSQWDYSGGRRTVHLHVHRQGLFPLVMGLLAATAAVAGCSSSAPPLPSPAATAAAVTASTQAAAEPDTEAGVRAAATAFYALYSAGQWPQAWEMLAPASQQAMPEALYVAVHQGCPSASAGIARVIESVTMAGAAAVVAEGLSGAGAAIGTVDDAWEYSAGRWGFAEPPSVLADYSHGSAAADIAALKAAGDCAGATPQPLPTLPLQTAAS